MSTKEMYLGYNQNRLGTLIDHNITEGTEDSVRFQRSEGVPMKSPFSKKFRNFGDNNKTGKLANLPSICTCTPILDATYIIVHTQ